MKTIRLLLVDDNAIARARLQTFLETAGDIHVVGKAENGQQAVLEAVRLQPDVVMLDLDMPVSNGVKAARQIAHEVPSARVVILSNYCDRQHVQPFAEAGVAGYLLKEAPGTELLKAIRGACAGSGFFSPPVLKLLKQCRKGRVAGPPLRPDLPDGSRHRHSFHRSLRVPAGHLISTATATNSFTHDHKYPQTNL